MTAAPNTSSYLLVYPDTADLPNSQTLQGGSGIALLNSGPGNTIVIQPIGNLATLFNYNSTGYLAYNASNSSFSSLALQGSSSIAITNPSGVGGDSQFSVIPNSTVQQIQVNSNGTLVSTSSVLNIVQGSNITTSVAFNSGTGATDVTISASPGAPTTAKYILQTPNGALGSAQSLSTLSTGLLKNANGTGVLSIAVSGTDYQAPSANLTAISAISPILGRLIIGNGSSFGSLDIGPNTSVLTSNGTSAYWSNEAGTGTVTSVGLICSDSSINISGTPNPITTLGTFTLSVPNWSTKTASQAVNLGGFKITNLATPVNPNDAATKAYVDAVVLPFTILSSGTTAVTIAAEQAYVPTSSGGVVTFTLPTAMSAGSAFRIAGFGSSGWILAQNAGQSIYFGNQVTTVGTGGSLASTDATDGVEIVCVVANTTFLMVSSVGNIIVT